MLELILTSWLAIIILMTITWVIYLKVKNPGIIDVAWSIAIMAGGAIYLISQTIGLTQLFFLTLLAIWGFRLAGHLFFNRVLPGHIDKRYFEIAENWKISKAVGFFVNYQFQGILALGIATPFIFIGQITSFDLMQVISSIILAVGIAGESIADKQLLSFRNSNPGKVCNTGLWKYSRHPNYFFEWLCWVGFAISCFGISWGWVGLIAPALLLYIMIGLTIPITESSSLRSRGKTFTKYQEKTSMFVPLPPKE